MIVGLGLLAVSAVMLIAGAELFTENGAATARGLRIAASLAPSRRAFQVQGPSAVRWCGFSRRDRRCRACGHGAGLLL